MSLCALYTLTDNLNIHDDDRLTGVAGLLGSLGLGLLLGLIGL